MASKQIKLGHPMYRDKGRKAGTDVYRDPAEVVRASELIAVLLDWIERWEAAHPDRRTNGFGAASMYEDDVDSMISVSMAVDVIPQMTARNWLAQESGMHTRTIYQLLSGKYRFEHVNFMLADKLLTAIGEHWRFGVDVHVVPNPHWTQEQWQAYMEQKGCY